MWEAIVLRRSDEYKKRPTCPCRKAANSKKLLLVLSYEKLAESLLLVADCLKHYQNAAFGFISVTRPPTLSASSKRRFVPGGSSTNRPLARRLPRVEGIAAPLSLAKNQIIRGELFRSITIKPGFVVRQWQITSSHRIVRWLLMTARNSLREASRAQIFPITKIRAVPAMAAPIPNITTCWKIRFISGSSYKLSSLRRLEDQRIIQHLRRN